MKYLIPLILMALVVPAAARLGETQAELVARYGEPVATDAKTRIATFHKDGMEVRVHIPPRGGADWLTFRKLSGLPLESDEWWKLLEANSQGEEWRDAPGGGGSLAGAVGRITGGGGSAPRPEELRFTARTRWGFYVIKTGVLTVALENAEPQAPAILDGF